MHRSDLDQLSDDELLVKKKKLQESKKFHALSIGILAGIVIFGVGSWFLSSEKHWGFLIPMLIPVAFIYNLVKNRSVNNDLEEVLKERKLN